VSSFEALPHSQQTAAGNYKVSNMEQDFFFRAIAEQNIELVREMLAKGAKVNALDLNGTVLYRSIRLQNFEISKLLVARGADCNIVQLDFDRDEAQLGNSLKYSWFFSTPIDYLFRRNINDENDARIKYLLENRPMINEDMVKQRIFYCTQLFDDKTHEMLFDYAASYFLRQNMYDHLYNCVPNATRTIVAATFNMDASVQRKPLDDGVTHEAFFIIVIRSLLEQLVRFKLGKCSYIKTDQQYAVILRELVHNIETYNLFVDIRRIPEKPDESPERIKSFYPSIVKNIIENLKKMKDKEEYTLPVNWYGHALCVNFIRESHKIGNETKKYIAIRIDNLNAWEKKEHEQLDYKINDLVMIPKIIGEIPLEYLDHNKDYFISLVEYIRETKDRQNGIKILYHNEKLKYLDTSRVSTMTAQLAQQSKEFECFIQQAEANCFYKSHEPGFAIRSNDSNIYQEIIRSVRNCATKLTTEDLAEKRNELDEALEKYWKEEPTISKYVFGRIIFVENTSSDKSYNQQASSQNHRDL
jgi:hypothetical protein